MSQVQERANVNILWTHGSSKEARRTAGQARKPDALGGEGGSQMRHQEPEQAGPDAPCLFFRPDSQ